MKKQAWEVVLKDRFLNSEKRDNPFVVAFLYFIVFVLSFLLVFIVFFQLCLIDGDSMNPYLQNKDHVLLLKSNNYISFGDIVVITKLDSNGKKYNIIKRVIGLPGDSIEFKKDASGKITLYRKAAGTDTFTLLNEPYINEEMTHIDRWENARPNAGPVKIGDAHLFVLGDNRNHSADSRGADGQYTIDAVYGELMFKVEKNSILEFLLSFIYQEKSVTQG